VGGGGGGADDAVMRHWSRLGPISFARGVTLEADEKVHAVKVWMGMRADKRGSREYG